MLNNYFWKCQRITFNYWCTTYICIHVYTGIKELLHGETTNLENIKCQFYKYSIKTHKKIPDRKKHLTFESLILAFAEEVKDDPTLLMPSFCQRLGCVRVLCWVWGNVLYYCWRTYSISVTLEYALMPLKTILSPTPHSRYPRPEKASDGKSDRWTQVELASQASYLCQK